MRRARSRSGSAASGRPSSRTRPASGSSNPTSRRSRVDLPAPFGPSRPTMLPPSSDTDTSRTAARPPSRFVTPSAARAFIPSPHSRSGPAERDPDAGIGAYPGRTVREDLLIVLIQQVLDAAEQLDGLGETRTEEHTAE